MCSVCREQFTRPVTLTCGHTACEDCLVGWFETQEKSHNAFSCPLCRELLPNQLPGVNRAIEAVIEAGGRTRRRRSERTVKRAEVFRKRLAAGVPRGFETGSAVAGAFREGRGVQWHTGRVIRNMHGTIITVRFDSDRHVETYTLPRDGDELRPASRSPFSMFGNMFGFGEADDSDYDSDGSDFSSPPMSAAMEREMQERQERLTRELQQAREERRAAELARQQRRGYWWYYDEERRDAEGRGGNERSKRLLSHVVVGTTSVEAPAIFGFMVLSLLARWTLGLVNEPTLFRTYSSALLLPFFLAALTQGLHLDKGCLAKRWVELAPLWHAQIVASLGVLFLALSLHDLGLVPELFDTIADWLDRNIPWLGMLDGLTFENRFFSSTSLGTVANMTLFLVLVMLLTPRKLMGWQWPLAKVALFWHYIVPTMVRSSWLLLTLSIEACFESGSVLDGMCTIFTIGAAAFTVSFAFYANVAKRGDPDPTGTPRDPPLAIFAILSFLLMATNPIASR